LLDQVGLNYICATAERFYAVSQVLSNMVDVLVKERSARLLKHIVRCYARLCDNPRARDALRTCLPEAIRDQTFGDVYKTDSTINQWIQKLMHALHVTQ
jgi:CCR4-NOT transcription complex subunit 9